MSSDSDLDHFDPDKRHDFTLFFDATNSNPNGDPNLDNLPRHDPDTGEGIATGGSIKRKVRDWMIARGETVLVQPVDGSLQDREIDLADKVDDTEDPSDALQKHCIDVRLFGHVLTGESDADSVWGPVQVSDAVSVHPVDIENMAITRVLRSSEEEGGGMGRRGVVRYGLYKAKGSFSPGKASDHVTKKDLKLLYEGLLRGFEHSASAARPDVEGRKLLVVTHEDELGNAPRSKTSEVLRAETDVDHPRSIKDFEFVTEEAPDGTERKVFEPYDETLSPSEEETAGS
ncbi:MAG: CRISPR-associated protein [Salinibacter sp.]